jgi:MFS superfamily sulfate permease-like transporter
MKASPKYVHMHFHKGEVTDFSAVSALQSVAEMFKGEGSELHLFQLSRDSHRMMIKSSKLLQDVHGFHSEEVNLQRGLDWVPNKDLADQTITDAKKRP